jgi:hypothetical protein
MGLMKRSKLAPKLYLELGGMLVDDSCIIYIGTHWIDVENMHKK